MPPFRGPGSWAKNYVTWGQANSTGVPPDIRHLSIIDCLSFVMCLLQVPFIIGFFSFFLLRPFTVLMKQTRQAVCAVRQSIFLRCLCTRPKETTKLRSKPIFLETWVYLKHITLLHYIISYDHQYIYRILTAPSKQTKGLY